MKRVLEISLGIMMFCLMGFQINAASIVSAPCNRTTTLTYGKAYTECSAGSHYKVGAWAASNNHYASCNAKSGSQTLSSASSSGQYWIYDTFYTNYDLNHSHTAASAFQSR